MLLGLSREGLARCPWRARVTCPGQHPTCHPNQHSHSSQLSYASQHPHWVELEILRGPQRHLPLILCNPVLHWLWGDEVPAGHSAGEEPLVQQVRKRFSSRWLCCRAPLLPPSSPIPSPVFSLLSSFQLSPLLSSLSSPCSILSFLFSCPCLTSPLSILLTTVLSTLPPLPPQFSFLHSLSPPLPSALPFSCPSQASSLITQVPPITNCYDQVLGKSNGLFKPKIQWEMFQSRENKWARTGCRKPPDSASRNFPEPLGLTDLPQKLF